MDKKSIGIDLDSTLNCLEQRWIIERYNQDFSDNLTREDMFCWEVETYIKSECGKNIYNYLQEPNFFKTLGIKPHAQEVTKWLSQYFDLYVVTAYTPKVCVDKAGWIEDHFPHISQKNIIFCNSKGLIHTDLLIDDGGHNILEYHEGNKSGLPIIFDAPWNRYLKNDFLRVYDWLEVKEYIKEIYELELN